jgi:TubC N-terminal docking domain
MSTSELVSSLILSGVTFELSADGFCVKAPPGVVTPDARSQLAASREEILAMLRRSPGLCLVECTDCSKPGALFSGLCFECSSLRLFLSNPLTCDCIEPRRWRYRDGGFYWHCENCAPAPNDAVWE